MSTRYRRIVSLTTRKDGDNGDMELQRSTRWHKGTCIQVPLLPAVGTPFGKIGNATNPDYSTVSFSSSSERNVDYYEAVMLLVPEGDTWAIKHLRSDK